MLARHYRDVEVIGFPGERAAWKQTVYEGCMVLSEEQELETFPFDVQTFTISIRCLDDGATLLPLPQAPGVPIVLFDTRTSDVEWTWGNVLIETDNKEREQTMAYIHIKGKRKFNNQMKALFVFTFCFYLLGLSTFAMVSNPKHARTDFWFFCFRVHRMLKKTWGIDWLIALRSF